MSSTWSHRGVVHIEGIAAAPLGCLGFVFGLGRKEEDVTIEIRVAALGKSEDDDTKPMADSEHGDPAWEKCNDVGDDESNLKEASRSVVWEIIRRGKKKSQKKSPLRFTDSDDVVLESSGAVACIGAASKCEAGKKARKKTCGRCVSREG